MTPNRIEIQIWLKRKGITQAQIARELRIAEPNISVAISRNSGRYKGRRVIDWLESHGCPKQYLGRGAQ